MTAAFSPPFGQADLTNCERELIHLAGSIQPHGVLLVLREPELAIVQLSANSVSLLGVPAAQLLNQPLAVLGGDLALKVQLLADAGEPAEPVLLMAQAQLEGRRIALQGALHRHPGDGTALILELQAAETLGAAAAGGDKGESGAKGLHAQLAAALQQFASASNLGTLADAVARSFRDMTGYDRVMVYKFDPDGHGKIIAEARDPRLESLLGHHYPASDIPQRARELYIRNRVRVLVDVHYEAVPLVPHQLPGGADLDMSLCHLRSMSPLHLQYLKNMGVTATLVVSLIHEGRLWGLVAAHHYVPRKLPLLLKTTCELMAEVIGTRIAAIENYAHAQVAILVRRLEQRLIEATSSEGDWRLALFRSPRTLLQPLEASGAALFHDGDVLSSGEVPSTPELRALLQWVHANADDTPFACSSVGRANPALETLTPVASGVLAVKLSSTRPDYLMWFRKEQLTSVTWAGDPTKPVIGNDPLELSPRRSFAAWSEIVRGTATPWSTTETMLARAVGVALVDIIVQVHAVRLLIAEHQLAQTRATVRSADEPVLIADAKGAVLFTNPAFEALIGGPEAMPRDLDGVAELFVDVEALRRAFASLGPAQQAWRGEPVLVSPRGDGVPVVLRAEVVQGRDGARLGFMLLFTDLRDSKKTEAARAHLEHALAAAAGRRGSNGNAGAREADEVMSAILTNASLAAMDIADASGAPSMAPLIEELENATRRATDLYEQVRVMLGGANPKR